MQEIDKNRELLFNARKKHHAIGAFNFSEISQVKGIISAARKTGQPFILQTSEGESKYLGLETAVALKNLAERELGKQVILNLDHGKSFEYLKKAIAAGYTMVHFDGAGLPFEENVKITRSTVEYAHKHGVLVEGEVGVLKGASKVHREKIIVRPEDMTHPEEAKEFVERTGVDFIATVVGNLHGLYLNCPKKLDLKRLSEIRKAIGDKAFLTMHGGSGIPPGQVKKAITSGIVKINVNTELRLAWRKGIEKSFRANKDEVAPPKIMPAVADEVARIVEKKMLMFVGKS